MRMRHCMAWQHERGRSQVDERANVRTLGPRGPFRQSGVDVVSQLAHRRAGGDDPRPADSLQDDGATPPPPPPPPARA
jgi:hypothetical protein